MVKEYGKEIRKQMEMRMKENAGNIIRKWVVEKIVDMKYVRKSNER